MKIGLLSDIHGNAEALSKVLEEARSLDVSRLIISGDMVGYYYQVDRVLSMLDEWDCDYIRGNHEEMLESWLKGFNRDFIRSRYGSSLMIAEAMLSKSQLSWLIQLPLQLELEIDQKKVFVCHGSPSGVDDYVYPDASDDDWQKFEKPGFDIIVFGHTHYPVVRSFPGGFIVNPGSVGQPRDRMPGASWAIWDTIDGSVEAMRTPYDPSTIIEQCQIHDPDIKYLREVLVRT